MKPIPMIKIRQSFNRPLVADVGQCVRDQLARAGLKLPPGASIALAVGSRGIANLAIMVRAAAGYLREKGFKPFIIPAMGSHGRALAEGQKEILASYGVTEEATGCEVRSSMEVIELPNDGLEHRLFIDSNAYRSDGIILINRIKPHTDFHGSYESGLVKMSIIGLGKQSQASEIHRFGIYGLKELIPKASQKIMATGKIVLGLAVVENAYDETALIEAIAPEDIFQREPQLLDFAKSNMPSLPVDRLDVLVIDRMGKDISGAGIDPNIIGRLRIHGQPEPQTPEIRMIVVSDLTEVSHGNAAGIGLADVVTRRLVDKIDFQATYQNIVTSTFYERGKLPIVAETDEQALEYALRGCGPIPEGRERIIRIEDTLHLSELYVSPAVWEELTGREGIEQT